MPPGRNSVGKDGMHLNRQNEPVIVSRNDPAIRMM